jgi:hypothetical protein
VKVAESIRVFWVRRKSSAVSVSSLPGLEGRDKVAIFPSGDPVLKKKSPARADWVQAKATIATGTKPLHLDIFMSFH